MREEGYILNQLKTAALPKVPDMFFSDFSDELWQLIKLEDETEGFLDELVFKRFENDLENEKIIDLHSGNYFVSVSKGRRLNRTKTKHILLWAGAIAASFAIFFTWPDTTISTTELASDELTQEVILAYLDEDDLVNYLVDADENEVDETKVEDEVLYEELEDEIYNYINDI